MLLVLACAFGLIAVALAGYFGVIPYPVYLALVILLLLVALYVGGRRELRKRPARVPVAVPVDDYARPEGPEAPDAR